MDVFGKVWVKISTWLLLLLVKDLGVFMGPKVESLYLPGGVGMSSNGLASSQVGCFEVRALLQEWLMSFEEQSLK